MSDFRHLPNISEKIISIFLKTLIKFENIFLLEYYTQSSFVPKRKRFVKRFTKLSGILASGTGAPEPLDIEEVIPPGRSAPHGVGVHDAQVLALLDCTASPGSDLKLHKKIFNQEERFTTFINHHYKNILNKYCYCKPSYLVL
jgi:hypothetical protein